MHELFISYRRDDSQGFAGRLCDDLSDLFGQEAVFRDVEIPPGSDYTKVLRAAVARSAVLLVVIGRHWHGQSEDTGRSRLFDPEDWVRAEIEAGLERQLMVLPVLVGGARMPRRDELPQSIETLTKIQAWVMTDRDWDQELIALGRFLQQRAPGRLAPIGSKPDADSPARVLRDLGDRVLDEVRRQRGPIETSHSRSSWLGRLGRAIWNALKRSLSTVLVLAIAYVAIRAYGDPQMLSLLDKAERVVMETLSRLGTLVRMP